MGVLLAVLESTPQQRAIALAPSVRTEDMPVDLEAAAAELVCKDTTSIKLRRRCALLARMVSTKGTPRRLFVVHVVWVNSTLKLRSIPVLTVPKESIWTPRAKTAAMYARMESSRIMLAKRIVRNARSDVSVHRRVLHRKVSAKIVLLVGYLRAKDPKAAQHVLRGHIRIQIGARVLRALMESSLQVPAQVHAYSVLLDNSKEIPD